MRTILAALTVSSWLCHGCAEVHQAPPDAGPRTAIHSVTGALAEAEPDLSHAWFVDEGPADGYQLVVVLSSAGGTCEHVRVHGREPADSWLLIARVIQGYLDGEVRVPGTYDVRSTEIPVVVSLQRGDATCANTLPGGPTPLSPETGIVVFHGVEDGQLRGRYELDFAIGRIEGTFLADPCSLDAAREDPPECVPPDG